MYEFKMPSLGADMDSAKLVEWLVKPGDTVKKGDVIAVVETTKSAVNVEVWKNGVIEKILVEPGEEQIPVGSVLALIRLAEGETEEAPAEEKVSSFPPRKAAATPVPPKTEIHPPASPEGPRLHVSPAARRLAHEFHLDLNKIQGTGPHGVVTLEDVQKAVAGQTPSAGAGQAPSAGAASAPVTDKKLLMRQAIAAAMERSHREIPHYYLETQINLHRALEWMESVNKKRPPERRLLSAALLLKAVALGLKKVPELNGFYRNGTAQASDAIHVGVAISLREGGLMAPAIHDTDKKSLDEVMAALKDLAQRVRTGGLKSSELTDPTITVTNLGDEGVEKVFGIIYPPQVTLVGFGKIFEAPLVEGGLIVPRRVVIATLAADHRVSDGHRGGLFLSAVSRFLQEPEKL